MLAVQHAPYGARRDMKTSVCEESGDAPPAHHGEERLELDAHGFDEVGKLVDRGSGLHARAGLVLLNPAVPAAIQSPAEMRIIYQAPCPPPILPRVPLRPPPKRKCPEPWLIPVPN